MSQSSPLKGKSILTTRTRKQSGSLAELLENCGATVIAIPTIEIVARPANEVDQVVRSAKDYDWLFFTSVNSVEIFFERAVTIGIPVTSLPRICTIGPATSKKVSEFGAEVALQPKLFQAEGILEEFSSVHQDKISGIRILLPRASQAREILPQTLRQRGAIVDVIPVYDTVVPESNREKLEAALTKQTVDLITLTSSSTVHNLVLLAGDSISLEDFQFASIGPITTETALGYGLRVVVQPDHSTIPDLVTAISDYFRN